MLVLIAEVHSGFVLVLESLEIRIDGEKLKFQIVCLLGSEGIAQMLASVVESKCL